MLKRFISAIRHVFSLDGLLLAIIGVVTVIDRIVFLGIPRVMPPGDTFNFISASKQLFFFTYPASEKRLPLYPLLIELLSPFGDVIEVATIIAAAASVLVVILLYCLGRALRLNRWILTMMLFLAAVEPHLASSGIRPLADSLFLALVLAGILLVITWKERPPTYARAILMGVMLVCILLTRHEGMAIAAALAAALMWYWRASWKHVVAMVATVLVLLAPWVTITYQTRGTLWYLGYTEEISSPDDRWGIATLEEFVNNGRTLATYTNWDGFIAIATLANEELMNGTLTYEEFRQAIFGSAFWWLSLIAFIGALWLLISRPKDGLIIAMIGGGFFMMMAYWGPTYRFSAPILPFWLLAIAAGADFVTRVLQKIFPSSLGFAVATLWLVILVSNQVPSFVTETYGRVSDNNGRGYAQLAAIRYAERLDGVALTVSARGAFQAYFGLVDRRLSPPQRGVLIDAEDATDTDFILEQIRTYQVKTIIVDPTELQDTIAYLTDQGLIETTTVFPSLVESEQNSLVIQLR